MAHREELLSEKVDPGAGRDRLCPAKLEWVEEATAGIDINEHCLHEMETTDVKVIISAVDRRRSYDFLEFRGGKGPVVASLLRQSF